MRWLTILVATAAAAVGEGGNFSGTAFDTQTGRTQVISGTLERQEPTGHEKLMSAYDDIIRSSQESVANMRAQSAQWELESQTRELEAQTKLLREMSEKVASQPSTPPTVIVNPIVEYSAPEPSYGGAVETVSAAPSRPVPPSQTMSAETSNRLKAIRIAKYAHCFSERGKALKSDGASVKNAAGSKSSNDEVMKNLLRQYAGEFTDYGWRAEKIDPQTYLVICEVSLDGEKRDLRFKVNTEVESCRYEGGTALAQLYRPMVLIPLDENGKPLGEEEWWKEAEPVQP
jgi:hypothetical protein